MQRSRTKRVSKPTRTSAPPLARHTVQLSEPASVRAHPIRHDAGGPDNGMGASEGGLHSVLGGGRESVASGGTATGSDDEGLGLLRQQLSAVQRIRIEHERKDATIAALRLEVVSLTREREEALALRHEHEGVCLRMAGVEERCRQLELAERDSAHRWARKEEVWRTQLRDVDERLRVSQEQYRAERDRAEELTALKAELEPALAAAESEAAVATAEAKREQSGRAQAEFRAGTMAESLNLELEGERRKAKGLKEKMRLLERDLKAATDESARLAPCVTTLEERVENLRIEGAAVSSRCSEAELELAQLQVYHPLVERADAIDRQRLDAEERLRAAQAELERERASLIAAKRDTTELQAAFDRRGTRLAEAEIEANKALSLKSDLLSATSRLQTAEADKVKAITTCREADDNRLVITAAVDELAELASEVIPPLPPFETSFTQGRGQNETKGNKEHAGRVGAFVVISEAVGIPAATVTNGRSVQVQGDGHACGTQYGYGSASHCRRDDAMKKLAEVDIKLRRRGASELTNTNGRTENGAERGPGWIGSGDREGGLCAVVLGNSEIRRAVRAVRALADAGVRVAADRDRAIIEAARAHAETRSLRDDVDASRKEKERLAKALEDASVARSALIPRMRDAQVSKHEAEAEVCKTRLELRDIRDFLGSLAGAFARRPTEAFVDGDTSPLSDCPPATTSTAGTAETGPPSARLISAVSAGVKGLLAGRAASAESLRDLEERCAHQRREAKELLIRLRDRDAAHREQLTELRTWCESEVETQRRGKTTAHATADRALADLRVALRRISTFEKEMRRVSHKLSAVDGEMSSLAAEAATAKSGLRLLARACVPLLERCRLLALHKRLLTGWYGRISVSIAGIGDDNRTLYMPDSEPIPSVTEAVRPAAGPSTAILVKGMRALAAALSRGSSSLGTETEVNIRDRRLGSHEERAFESPPRSSTSSSKGEDSERDRVTDGGERVFHCPLVSLRAVGLVGVAVQRLLRLAACKKERRQRQQRGRSGSSRPPAVDRGGTAAGKGCKADSEPTNATAANASDDVYVVESNIEEHRGYVVDSDSSSGGRREQRASKIGAHSPARRSPEIWRDSGHTLPLRARSTQHDGDLIPLGVGSGDTGSVRMLSEGDVPPISAKVLANGGAAARCLLSPIGPRTKGTSGRALAGDAPEYGRSAAARCRALLEVLVIAEGSERDSVEGVRVARGQVASDAPTLLQMLARGQVGHWRRLEDRGLVPMLPVTRGTHNGTAVRDAGGELNGGGASRVIASRYARHHRNAWRAWQKQAGEDEALRLLEGTRRGTAALARCAGEAESRLMHSETKRLRATRELEVSSGTVNALRADLEEKAGLVSFLEERLRIMEGEAAGTVSAAALAGTEKALTESMAEVETLRVRGARLEAGLAEASATRKREEKKARKGAQAACQEKVVRAQLQDELLSLRSYVLRSEQTVQELQEEARNQARAASRRKATLAINSTTEDSAW